MTEEDNLLACEGLCRDPLCLPLFSFYDMFELLLKHRKIGRAAIKRKLLVFHDFLVAGRIPFAPRSLSGLVAGCDGGMRDDLISDAVFYNTSAIAAFAYLFGVRLELFFAGRDGVMGCQYFGLKRKPVKRVFMSEDSFCLLKKVLTKTNTQSTRIGSDLDLRNLYSAAKNSKIKEEHWNKNTYKSECMYKLKSSVPEDKKIRRIDEELDSFDSMDDKRDTVSVDRDAAEQVCSIECLGDTDEPKQAPTFDNLSTIEPSLPQIDTERFLDDWAKDIAQDAKPRSPPPQPQIKSSAVIAGVTHVNVDGLLKFYSEVKEYGFIVTADEAEIFVHKADLVKQNIDTRSLAYYRKFYNIAVRFDIEEYQGKTNKHRKAINMVILSMTPICE